MNKDSKHNLQNLPGHNDRSPQQSFGFRFGASNPSGQTIHNISLQFSKKKKSNQTFYKIKKRCRTNSHRYQDSDNFLHLDNIHHQE